MRSGARTPEQLETLLEDAFVLRDRGAVAELFTPQSILAIGRGARASRGREIPQMLTELWADELEYIAQPRLVLQARDTALVVSERSLNVALRADRHWRYAIALLDHPLTEPKGG